MGYNKDPNTQVYVIRRLDRETGRMENYITGARGSAWTATSARLKKANSRTS